jgi:hypothetical protein
MKEITVDVCSLKYLLLPAGGEGSIPRTFTRSTD